MPLEAGDGFISGLVATNPVNATDQVAQGDDHLRLIKTALKGTFPNLNAAVTSSPAELNILDGVTLTAAQINDAAQKAVANTFTANHQDIVSTGTTAAYWRAKMDTSEAFFGVSDGSGQLISGDSAGMAGITGSAGIAFSGNNGSTMHASMDASGNYNFKSGTVTTNNVSASEVGFKGVPQNVQDGNYTLVLADAGKSIDKQSGGAGETITIPANASVAFPIGTVICGDNDGGGTLTIAITTDTLEDTAGNTGSRTVADNGCWAIRKIAATKWRITGSGIS